MAYYKYQKLEDHLRDEIRMNRLRAGDKIPTETEMMEQFKVGRKTVRRAIEHLEEEGLLRRIQGSGTYVRERGGAPGESADRRAVNGPNGAGRTVSLIMADTTSYIFPEILNGASDALSENGYTLNVLFTDSNYDMEHQILHRLIDAPPAGVIAEPLNFGLLSVNEPDYRRLAEVTSMLMIHTQETDICPSLSLRDREGAAVLTDHLIELGHRRIGTIFCANEATGQIRYMGYLDSLRRHGLVQAPGTDLWYMHSAMEEFFAPTGSYGLSRMLDSVTAVICMDDRLALKLINFLQERGMRVPEDVSVTGYDDSYFATLQHQITTIEHPKYRYGYNAGLAILDMIRIGRVDPARYERPPRLITRETTAPPRE